MTDDTWGLVKSALQKNIGKNNFTTWIAPLEYVGMDGTVAEFHVNTGFQGDWISRNFGDQILREIANEGIKVERLSFSVPKSAKPSASCGHHADTQVVMPSTRPVTKPVTKSAAKFATTPDQIMTANLDKRFTFDSFVVGKPNELAHAAARRVAENGPVSFNPLFLYGGVGLGKTHLMHAIGWELQKVAADKRVVYLSAEQFMYRFVQALRDKQMMDFKQMFRAVDVLMVDDVQFIGGKNSTQDEFFHTFNALVDQGKQIIISADRAPGEIDGLEERIKSRLQWGLVVDLHPTDYELRLGILQQKVEMHRAQYPDLVIGNGVLEFLAQRISNNVRVLEGGLTRLFALASLIGREITIEMTQDSLADILRQSDHKITMDEIMRKTCDYYSIRMADMTSARRSRNIARPRQMAMWLAKHLTSRSYPEIGKRFGNRDHTTVMHAVKKIDELKGFDSQIAEDAENLRRMLEA